MTQTILFRREIDIDRLGRDSNATSDSISSLFELYTTCPGRNLHARLAADSDPFFLYCWSITSDEYLRLKESQGLLLSFDEFPKRLAELVQRYRQRQEPATDTTSYSIRMQQQSDDNGSFKLAIVEENAFRTFEVVSLVLAPADEAQLQQHIRSMVSQLRHDNGQLEAQCNEHQRLNEQMHGSIKQLNEQLSAAASQAASLDSQLAAIRSELQAAVQERDFLQVERDAFLRSKTDVEAGEREQRSKIDSLTRQVDQLTRQVDSQAAELAAKSKSLVALQASLEKHQAEAREANQSKRHLADKVERLEETLQDQARMNEAHERTKRQLERVLQEKALMQREIENQDRILQTLKCAKGVPVQKATLPPIPRDPLETEPDLENDAAFNASLADGGPGPLSRHL